MNPHPPKKPSYQRAASLLKLPLNKLGRDWFVGDLHGEFELLQRFMREVEFDTRRDRLISVGDLCDRGPQVPELLELFGHSQDWFHAVLGNHDALVREAVLFQSWYAERAWVRVGDFWARTLPRDRREKLAAYLLRMPLAIEVPLMDGRRVGVIHAELPLDAIWTDVESAKAGEYEASSQGPKLGTTMLWGRTRVAYALKVRRAPKASGVTLLLRWRACRALAPVDGIDLVVMGHTTIHPKRPLSCSNLLWIDTGGGFQGGRLTFVDVSAGEWIQFAHKGKPLTGQLEFPAPLAGWRVNSKQEQIARRKQEVLAIKQREALAFALFGYG